MYQTVLNSSYLFNAVNIIFFINTYCLRLCAFITPGNANRVKLNTSSNRGGMGLYTVTEQGRQILLAYASFHHSIEGYCQLRMSVNCHIFTPCQAYCQQRNSATLQAHLKPMIAIRRTCGACEEVLSRTGKL